MSRLRLGTRASALALWQSRHVASRLRAAHPGVEIEEIVIETEGDRKAQRPIAALPDRGVFVRQIQQALLAGRVDLAVHSLKDLPTVEPQGLVIASVPERHDPRDAILTRDGRSFEDLAPGSTLATGSPRRWAQLLHARPDLRMVPVRGNVDTRVRKLQEGQFEALVLALAGVERLGIRSVGVRPLAPALCLPAVGQGALAIEAREDDGSTRALVAVLSHGPTLHAVAAERAFLRRLGGGCLAPATAHAVVTQERFRIEAAVGTTDGRRLLRDRDEGDLARAEEIASALAQRMLAAGADAILASARSGIS